MPIPVQDGSLIIVAGKLALAAPCCCTTGCCIITPGATLTAVVTGLLTGSLTLTEGGLGGYDHGVSAGSLTGCSGEFNNVDVGIRCVDDVWEVQLSGSGADCAFGTPTVQSVSCGPPFQIVITAPIIDTSGSCSCTPGSVTITITED